MNENNYLFLHTLNIADVLGVCINHKYIIADHEDDFLETVAGVCENNCSYVTPDSVYKLAGEIKELSPSTKDSVYDIFVNLSRKCHVNPVKNSSATIPKR